MSNSENDERPILNPDEWVDKYGDYLFRYAFSRLRDQTAAEEVVQETFLAGVRYAAQYSGRGSEQGWLTGILKRKIVDYVRARSKHKLTGPYEDEMDLTTQLFDAKGNWKAGAIPWSPDPSRGVEMEELWDVVKGCLKNIPQTQADVFVLSVMEEMDAEQICQELGITPSNLWVRMHRARLGLAKCVGAKWNQNEEVQNVKR